MKTDFETIYETTINAPVEKVWDALTNPAVVKQYFFGSDLETDWQVGSPIYFKGEYEGKYYQDKGTVLEFVPNKQLAYSYLSDWTNMEDVPESYLLVKYEVEEADGKTILRINQTNYDAEKAEHSEASWGTVIDGLKKLVE